MNQDDTKKEFKNNENINANLDNAPPDTKNNGDIKYENKIEKLKIIIQNQLIIQIFFNTQPMKIILQN